MKIIHKPIKLVDRVGCGSIGFDPSVHIFISPITYTNF